MSYSSTANNPVDWFGSDYDYNTGFYQINVDLNMFNEEAVGGSEGTYDGYHGMGWGYNLDEAQGDVRYVYYAYMRYLWTKYNNKNTDPNHVMPENMKMYRSQVRNRNLNERTTTYTITFTESESSVTDTVGARMIKNES